MGSSAFMETQGKRAWRMPYNQKFENTFKIAMLFNNGSMVVLTSESGPVDGIEGESEHLKKEALTLLRSTEDDFYIHEQGILDNTNPTYSLLRRHPECSFILTLMGKSQLTFAEKKDFYERTKFAFERGCIEHLDKMAFDLMQTEKFKFYFILANKRLRDAVIRQGYEQELSLSPRELECLWIATQDNSVKEIAKIMKISPATVETYLKNIRETFGSQSLSAIIVESIHRGILGKISCFGTGSTTRLC